MWREIKVRMINIGDGLVEFVWPDNTPIGSNFNKLCNQQLLQTDQKQSAQHLKDDFNLSNWQRLKAIKQTLT